MPNIEVSCDKNKVKAVKSLLKLYRKVLHSVNNHPVYLDDETFVSSRKHLSELVDGLIIFETQAVPSFLSLIIVENSIPKTRKKIEFWE